MVVHKPYGHDVSKPDSPLELWEWAQLRDGEHWVWHAVRHVQQVAVTPLFKFRLACDRTLSGIGVSRQAWPYPGEATCERCVARQQASRTR